MGMVATHRKEFIGELALLSKLRHPNIMQFLGAVTKSQPLVIVTEYLPKVIAQVYYPLLMVCGCGCDDLYFIYWSFLTQLLFLFWWHVLATQIFFCNGWSVVYASYVSFLAMSGRFARLSGPKRKTWCCHCREVCSWHRKVCHLSNVLTSNVCA